MSLQRACCQALLCAVCYALLLSAVAVFQEGVLATSRLARRRAVAVLMSLSHSQLLQMSVTDRATLQRLADDYSGGRVVVPDGGPSASDVGVCGHVATALLACYSGAAAAVTAAASHAATLAALRDLSSVRLWLAVDPARPLTAAGGGTSVAHLQRRVSTVRRGDGAGAAAYSVAVESPDSPSVRLLNARHLIAGVAAALLRWLGVQGLAVVDGDDGGDGVSVRCGSSDGAAVLLPFADVMRDCCSAVGAFVTDEAPDVRDVKLAVEPYLRLMECHNAAPSFSRLLWSGLLWISKHVAADIDCSSVAEKSSDRLRQDLKQLRLLELTLEQFGAAHIEGAQCLGSFAVFFLRHDPLPFLSSSLPHFCPCRCPGALHRSFLSSPCLWLRLTEGALSNSLRTALDMAVRELCHGIRLCSFDMLRRAEETRVVDVAVEWCCCAVNVTASWMELATQAALSVAPTSTAEEGVFSETLVDVLFLALSLDKYA